MAPLVSILMPVYNCRLFIEASISSILNQSYTRFELIVIDDCSTDGTLQFLSELNDPRVILIKKIKNTGYTNSLNYGLKLCKGKYIARMDGDDISMVTRIEEQVVFMEDNPDIDVCGTWFNIMGTDEIIKHPHKHNEIKVALLKYCAIGHPTVN
jgi:glycosyltransferase involved in cell wall biosynthesis